MSRRDSEIRQKIDMKTIDKLSDAGALAQLSEQIKSIDEAYKRIEAGPLKRRAILVLLKDISGLPISTIETVINALGILRNQYLK